ncbi:class I SAM-dependent methyltransferase [Brevibacillus borstelensis]|uniref:class I SAM-dependent methyltransferase n=1 Tax=Brevibacillus borstelensis TaxID=45462 RepID=UPI0030C3CC2C
MNPKILHMKNLLYSVETTDGWLTTPEAVALLHLPLLVDHVPGAIVEIGSYKGKSAVALGLGSMLLSKQKRPVHAIDPFQPHYDGEQFNDFHAFKQPYFDSFWNNITNAGLQNHVKVIPKFSNEAYTECPDPIAALFIDGDHRYEGVKQDILLYTPKVAKNGIIAFHDYMHAEGVTRAVDELCAGNAGFEYVTLYENSLLLVRKVF